MAQHAPTKATSRKIDDEGPNPMRAEAIAMRRIVVEMGYWLSPFMRDTPLPVLSEWERTVNLATLDHNCKTRQRSQAQTSENVLATVDNSQKHKGERHRNVGTPTVVDVQIARTKTPATRETLQARKAHKTKVVELAKAQGKSPADVERELAIARVAAIAEQKAAEEAKAAALTEQARKARRLETARKANARYEARCKADPVLAEQRRKKQRDRDRLRRERRKAEAAPAPVGAQSRIPNPHRDPTLPTARQLREEAIAAEEARLLRLLQTETKKAKRSPRHK